MKRPKAARQRAQEASPQMKIQKGQRKEAVASLAPRVHNTALSVDTPIQGAPYRNTKGTYSKGNVHLAVTHASSRPGVDESSCEEVTGHYGSAQTGAFQKKASKEATQ